MTSLKQTNVEALLGGLKSEATVRAYSRHWQAYLDFAGSALAVDDAETLAAWRQHLIKNTVESPNTINLRLASVKAIFKELTSRKLISKEIFWAMRDVEGLKANALTKRRKPNARVRIEPEQMRGLVETPNIQLGDPVGARDRALLLLFATSGVRISEAVAVKVADIQKSNGSYLIANIMGKGQSQARVSPLSVEAYLAIQDWLYVRPTHSEYVFTSVTFSDEGVLYTRVPITTYAAYKIVKRVAAKYGMPQVKPHDFRRFVGTQLAKVDIRKAQKVLGHRHIGTTADHYVLDDVPLGTTEGLF